ncbi:MAG TPA: glycosyltransferase family 2 protein [Bacteroidales bacterium]|nr:glycosyltransferase family 2 protein [Bacteroidales bacterium]
MNNTSIGVIISTYNNPTWLQKVLWGYTCQTVMPDEIIIADDGSRDETRKLIDSFRDRLPVKHVWHPDNGFQKCRILNMAILEATSDYLIFTDQDCIPRNDFVEVHLKYAQKGYLLSGGYVRLPMELSKNIIEEDIRSGNAFSLRWSLKGGLPLNFKCTKLIKSKVFTQLMNFITPTRATWNGCNSSGWKADMLTINGFNEEMQYGGQDREFGERLVNLGLKSKQIRYSAILLHLDHSRPYKTPESIAKNVSIRKNTRKKKIIETPRGIKQYLESRNQ